MKFSTYFLHFSSYLDKVQYRACPHRFILLYAFYANWHSESHDVLKCINECTSVFSTLLFSLGEIGYWGHEHNVAEHLGVLGEWVH